MRRSEEQFNTIEQVEHYLVAALLLVEKVDPADDLRVAFFTKAADLLAGKQVFFERPQTVGFDPRILRSN